MVACCIEIREDQEIVGVYDTTINNDAVGTSKEVQDDEHEEINFCVKSR